MHTERLDRIARTQHGLVTRLQGLSTGLSARQFDHAARAGLLERLYPCVYRMRGAPRTSEQALLAVALAAGEGAAASHRAAAWLWGLIDDLTLEVSIPRGRRFAAAGVAVHRMEVEHRVRRRGIPCTNPLRTIVDLAAVVDAEAVDDAIDRGIGAGLVTVHGLASELERRAVRGRPGVGVVRVLLDDRLDDLGRPVTALERRMRRLLAQAGLPAPATEHPVFDDRYRIDFAWPDRRLAVEVDGYGSHSSRSAFVSDRRRQNELVAEGWTILRFVWDDLVDRPEAVAGQISGALLRLTA